MVRTLELSSKIFIGRDQETALFEKMLDDVHNPKWILSLIGPGGQGKTLLLSKFAEIAGSRAPKGCPLAVTTTPIDFYWTTHQRELGVLDSLANQLETSDEFVAFRQHLQAYRELLPHVKDPAQLQYHLSEARNLFIEGYQQLAARRRLLLLFDTAELAGEALDHFWQQVLPELRVNTLIVIAGRQPVRSLPEEQVLTRVIGSFSQAEIKAYFKEQQVAVADEYWQRITELSAGRPILVALLVDWLRDGHALSELLDATPADFESNLVQRIRQLRFPEDQVILAMAHCYRRFNQDILFQVLGKEELTQDVSSLFTNLARFTFVKYRPAAEANQDSCLLHDEMRDLVVKHVWGPLDPLGEYRRDWSQKIVAYYQSRIDLEHDRFEQQNLCLERLHYWLEVDLHAAFAYSTELFERALENLDTDLMGSLNMEIVPYEKKLAVSMQREIGFRHAMVLYQKEHLTEAYEALNQFIEVATPGLLEARAMVALVHLCANTGKAERALQIGAQAEQLCQALLKQSHRDLEKQLIRQVLAPLYNNLGYTCRNALGNNNEASKYYEKVLDLAKQVDLYPSLIARVRNNLGFVYYRNGRHDEALSLCKAALRIRIHLDIPEEIGYNYNVIGMIYSELGRDEEAMYAFEEALRQFSRSRQQRGRAVVCVAYGKFLRQSGWYAETAESESTSVIDGGRKVSSETEDIDAEKQIARNEKYRRAKDLLEEGERIFRQIQDWSNQAEALNELGCLFRQVNDLEEAVAYLEAGVSSAVQAGNKPREADCLIDLGIAYYRADDIRRAMQYALKAESILQHQKDTEYLLSKVRHLLGDIFFNQGEYDRAFEYLAGSCTSMMKQYVKPRAYSEMLDSISEMIKKLPSIDLVRAKTQVLIDRWKEEGFVEKYKGFIVQMESLAEDYTFLKTQR